MGSEDDSHRTTHPLLGNDNPLVSELEQEVLDEYSRLLRNVNQVSQSELSPIKASHRLVFFPQRDAPFNGFCSWSYTMRQKPSP